MKQSLLIGRLTSLYRFLFPLSHKHSTSTLLRILYKDDQVPEDTLSFTQVLEKMRDDLKSQGFTQIPQLSSTNPIDVETDFDLVPATATGTRRAVMIGINYIGHSPGELRGCHNDVLNMVRVLILSIIIRSSCLFSIVMIPPLPSWIPVVRRNIRRSRSRIRRGERRVFVVSIPCLLDMVHPLSPCRKSISTRMFHARTVLLRL